MIIPIAIMKFYISSAILAISVFVSGFFIQKLNPCLSKLNMLKWSVYCSRGAGLSLAVFMSLLVMSTCKYSITFLHNNIKFVRRYLPEYSLKIHKTLGFIIILNVIIHVVSHYFNFYTARLLNLADTNYIHHKTYAGISGHVMMPFMIIMITFSGRFFKSWNYELFFYTHQLYTIVYAAFLFHSFGCFVKTNSGRCVPYYSVYTFGVPLLIFSIEKIYDLFKKKMQIKKVSIVGDVSKITFDKPFNFRPGQYINVIYKDIDKYTSHPFTITSSPQEEFMSIAVKTTGDWSKSLNEIFQKKWGNIDEKSVIPLDYLYITGPFASPCDRICDYSDVILVSTGIGITPFISILKDIAYGYKNEGKIKKINMIIINNNSDQHDWFDNVITDIYTTVPENLLKFDIFLTERFLKDEIDIINKMEIQNMNFMTGTDIVLNYGRPNFVEILKTHSGQKSVGVFSCSNESTNIAISNSIKKLNNEITHFDFIKEPFY